MVVDRFDLMAVASKLREAERGITLEEIDTPLTQAIVMLDALINPEVDYRKCSVCGAAENQASLLDVTVLVADGEEGHAWIMQLLCSSHAPAVIQTLYAAGFKDHRHGTSNHLEDRECPGFHDHKKCPTPDDELNSREGFSEAVLVLPKPNGVAH